MLKKVIFSFFILLLLVYLSFIKILKCSKSKTALQIKIESKLHKGMSRDEAESVLKKMHILYDIDKSGEMEIYFSKHSRKQIFVEFDKNYKYTGTCLADSKYLIPYILSFSEVE